MSRLINQRSPFLAGLERPTAPLSEEQSHREHFAALEATVFDQSMRARDELVFELDGGQLRLCQGSR